MLTLSWIFNLNNYISYFFIRPPPFLMLTLLLSHFKGDLSWTNIWILQGNDFPSRSYWPYLKKLLHLHPGLSALSDWHPSQITWRCFMGRAAWLHRWLQKSRTLSDRTVNCAISQLRFFTCMFFINNGMIHSFPCVNLMNIFLTFPLDRKHGSLFPPCLI